MNVLLTLGRMPKGLELARGLAANGCQVYVADPHKKHICRYSNSVTENFQVTAPSVSVESYVNDLLQIVNDRHIDLVVPVSEESVYSGLLKDKLPERVQYFGPGFVESRQLHDKYQFNQRLHLIGLPAPATALLGTSAAQALVAQHDVVIKPVHASAGIDIQYLTQGCELPEHTNRPSLVQQQMQGRLLTSFSVARDGVCLGTSVYEGTIMTGSVAIAFERVEDCAAVFQFVDAFIEKNNYTGFISFDIFVEADGLAYAIECNPRLTSGIHLFENSDVARAVINSNSDTHISYREQRQFQHFWPCLGTTELSLIKRGPFRKNFGHLVASDDVTWDRHDPMPAIMLNFCSVEIFIKYFREKMSLGEAAICDIEWREHSETTN